MIMSFSVPENGKYNLLIQWYKKADKQERSREFREIFLSYLNNSCHTMESEATNHVSRTVEPIQLRPVNIVQQDADDDLDNRLDNMFGIQM